ncbi:MAG: alanine dehydrogenase [Gammaproteobacteria bacterium]|nr:alanine dehydrogenase [Gammaproteobacteria bacterium]
MIIGVPKEVKKGEHRVGMVPSSVLELVNDGHEVLVETNAGKGIDIEDEIYKQHGAKIVATPAEIFAKADMIVKVKEPQASEYNLLREGQILFTYLHLAPDPQQANALVKSRCSAIAYETITDSHGGLPLLTPMSEVAGRLSIQAGAHCLEKAQNGRGILLGGVPGVGRGSVVIIGCGVVGTNALRMAIGTEARVTVLDKNLKRLREIDLLYGSKIKTLYATASTIEKALMDADLVVGAVLVHGGAAPKLITREMIKKMQHGSVIVDVSIDQGGCLETSRATSFDDPTYVVDGVVHYCVANMPGAVPRTSAFALNNATLPYVKTLANKGLENALINDPHFLNGLNVHAGHVTYEAVARDLNMPYLPAKEALSKHPVTA